MPDRPLTVGQYAAGVSLAAIALVYVFGPTYFVDGESGAGRKKGVVGLSNSANDCFINSVLQSLAGLGDLRTYLIRETHRRRLDGPDVYAHLVKDPARENLSPEKIAGLQSGMVTQGLKDVLDALNERPLYKKTMSASQFVAVLERAFRQRISRQQQDAQEFLQVVAERVMDEYHAGHRARKYAREHGELEEVSANLKLLQLAPGDVDGEASQHPGTPVITKPQSTISPQTNGMAAAKANGQQQWNGSEEYDEEEGFPMEGGSESQIECLTCGFKPQPTKTTFCSLTLSVPQVNSTTLSSIFDQMFKTEYIEDFKCEKCRLIQAVETLKQEHAKSTSDKFKTRTEEIIKKITEAIETNPEAEIDVELPDTRFAPKRKIAKYVRITTFPKVLAIHLSRSIFDAGKSTQKNVAKVSFPEKLPLGGLLNQRKYKLLSMVCHKGSHHSGHYESFRRQNVYPPYSTPNAFQGNGVYSKPPTPNPSQISTPLIPALKAPEDQNPETSTLSSTPELLSPMSAASTSSLPYTNGRRSGESSRNGTSRAHSNSTSNSSSNTNAKVPGPTSAPQDPEASSLRSVRSTVGSLSSRLRFKPSSRNPTPESVKKDEAGTLISDTARGRKKRSTSDRWWRISDERVKETTTSSVLSMQKEVYLLFYELEKGDDE